VPHDHVWGPKKQLFENFEYPHSPPLSGMVGLSPLVVAWQ
jgi:hypothetical protein